MGGVVDVTLDFTMHGQVDDTGGYSLFYRVTETLGAKVIRAFLNPDCRTQSDAVRHFLLPQNSFDLPSTEVWRKAEEEYELLRAARHCPHVPNPHCLTRGKVRLRDPDMPDRYHEGWLPAIVMEYIRGEPIEAVVRDGDLLHTLRDDIARVLLERYGITQTDLGGNILVERRPGSRFGIGRWWVIDFTPGYVALEDPC